MSFSVFPIFYRIVENGLNCHRVNHALYNNSSGSSRDRLMVLRQNLCVFLGTPYCHLDGFETTSVSFSKHTRCSYLNGFETKSVCLSVHTILLFDCF